MRRVRIYTASYCNFCARAKELLRDKGLLFEEVDVTYDDEARKLLVRLTEGRKTVPQIWVGDVYVGGYSDLARLEQNGELDQLLSTEDSQRAFGP